MTSLKRFFLITRHEFKVTAANKGFLITTLVGPVLIIVFAVLPSIGMEMAMESGPPDDAAVALFAPDGALRDVVSERLSQAEVAVQLPASDEAARAAVIEGTVAAAVLLRAEREGSYRSFTYIAPQGSDIRLSQVVERSVSDAVVSHRLTAASMDESEIERLTEPPKMMRVAAKDGADSGDPFQDAFMIAFAFVFLLYMTVIFYGQLIARSALGERTSKTVEIMLSSVDPLELMFGKVFGKGLAGIIQYGLWIGLALLLGTVAGPQLGIDVPPALSGGNLLALFVFFVGAFFLYSSAYAAIGAGAADEQHVGQLGIPLLAMLIVPMVLIAPIVMAPDSGLSVVLSIFPFTAPIVMLVRVLIGSPPLVHLIISLAILAATIAVTVWIAARIFRVAILASGTRPTLRQLLKYARG
jgi:ABC-2 type transport system permease protein